MTINWTSGDGRKVELTLTAEYELDMQGRRRTSGSKVVAESVTVDGREVDGYHVCKTTHPVAVAKIGNVGLTQANYDRYLAAYAEVEASCAAHNATCAANEAACEAASAASAKIYATP